MAKRHPLQNLLAPLLLPLAHIHGAAMGVRRVLAHKGLPRAWRAPCPCVCVGNISWGGTGKTPVVDWLLSWAEKQGLIAAVLTRGYGVHPPHAAFVVQAHASPTECGDEPLMLALRHPQATIVVDPNRSRGGQSLKPVPDIIFLDDGFQHLGTARDLDLVLLDKDDVRLSPAPGGDPSNWGRVLPAGTWREPANALDAAGAFLVKADPEEWADLVPALQRRLRTCPRPVFAFCLNPEGLHPISAQATSGNTALPATALAGPYVFVSGIGNPAQAMRTASTFLGRAPVRTLCFPDHHDFRASLAEIAAPGLPVVCTGKDAVKLATQDLPVPCFALDVRTHFFAALGVENLLGNIAAPAPDFPTWWRQWWTGRPHAESGRHQHP